MKLPTHAILFGRRRVEVLTYDGNGFFTVLDRGDHRVFTHRSNLVFLKNQSRKRAPLP